MLVWKTSVIPGCNRKKYVDVSGKVCRKAVDLKKGNQKQNETQSSVKAKEENME